MMTCARLNINNMTLSMQTSDSALFHLALYSDGIAVKSSLFDLARAILQIDSEIRLVNCSFIGMYLLY